MLALEAASSFLFFFFSIEHAYFYFDLIILTLELVSLDELDYICNLKNCETNLNMVVKGLNLAISVFLNFIKIF